MAHVTSIHLSLEIVVLIPCPRRRTGCPRPGVPGTRYPARALHLGPVMGGQREGLIEVGVTDPGDGSIRVFDCIAVRRRN
ncbi:putative protein OS=Streptomyces microflavus OX=1919 GN=Smic_83970 PE=4 SV=1 [Streptomyces microflavus]